MPTWRAPSWAPMALEAVIADLERDNQEVVQIVDASGLPLIVTRRRPKVGRPPKAETR